MNKEIKIEPIDNGFKASVEIPKELIDLELNEYLNKVDEINRLIITDKNELYIRELLNRLDKIIKYMELFKHDMETGGIRVDIVLEIANGKKDFSDWFRYLPDEEIEILKGDK